MTNQGFAEDSKVAMTVTFAPELTPVAAGGATPGVIEGRVVRFEPQAVLGAKQVLVWTVKAKGVAIGDVRGRAELTSELLTKPVLKEEATQVY